MKNIRIFLISFFILFIFSQINASSVFGVKMGIANSKYEVKFLSYDQYGNLTDFMTLFNKNRISPAMGLYLRYLDNEYFDMESEILYLQKGGEEKLKIRTLYNPEGNGELVYDIHFDYLQFQTCIRPNTVISDIGIYALVGFSLNYMLQVRNDYKKVNDFNRIIFAYSLGVGIEFDKIINKPIFIEFLFNNDMSEIYDEADFKFKSYLFRIGFKI